MGELVMTAETVSGGSCKSDKFLPTVKLRVASTTTPPAWATVHATHSRDRHRALLNRAFSPQALRFKTLIADTPANCWKSVAPKSVGLESLERDARSSAQRVLSFFGLTAVRLPRSF